MENGRIAPGTDASTSLTTSAGCASPPCPTPSRSAKSIHTDFSAEAKRLIDLGITPIPAGPDKAPTWAHRGGVYKPHPSYFTRCINFNLLTGNTLFVLDFDHKDIYDWFEARFPRPEHSALVKTSRGFHVYYRRTPLCDELELTDVARGLQWLEGEVGPDLDVDIKTRTGSLINGVYTSGNISAPPSLGKEWLVPLTAQLPDLPDEIAYWLKDHRKPRATKKPRVETTSPPLTSIFWIEILEALGIEPLSSRASDDNKLRVTLASCPYPDCTKQHNSMHYTLYYHPDKRRVSINKWSSYHTKHCWPELVKRTTLLRNKQPADDGEPMTFTTKRPTTLEEAVAVMNLARSWANPWSVNHKSGKPKKDLTWGFDSEGLYFQYRTEKTGNLFLERPSEGYDKPPLRILFEEQEPTLVGR